MEETQPHPYESTPAILCSKCGTAHLPSGQEYCSKCHEFLTPARIIPGVSESTCGHCGEHYKEPVPERCLQCHSCLPEADQMERTPAEIWQLKQNWGGDPCWDLYDTEGFGRYREELKAHQEAMEAKWDQQAIDREKAEMKRLGLAWPSHVPIYKAFKSLEYKIEKLTEQVDQHREEIYNLKRG